MSIDEGPLLFPAEPSFVNDSERRVWTALRDQLGPRDMLVANQHFSGRGRDHEIDLAVVFDGAGVVVVEVKGGTVWREAGQWWQQSAAGPRRIDPVEQAQGGKYVLRDWVEASGAWGGRSRIRWAHAVAFPGSEISPEFDSPDLHRWMVIDAKDLGDVAGRLRSILQAQEGDARASDVTDTLAIAEALDGRYLPQRDALLSLESRVAEHDAEIDRLSSEQARILDVIGLLNRVEVRGGAGSGKTFLAVEQARRLAKSGKRVALLSYSRGLATWMQRRAAALPYKERPAYVGTFHGIGQEWGAPDGSDDDSEFWEVTLPTLMLDLAREQPLNKLYDAIVIDEAQDFADLWWPVILAALKYEDDGLFVFTDEGQRVFARFGDSPAGLVPLVLDRNLRNTRQISSVFSTMAPNRMRISSYDGPEVRFVQCSADEAIARADDVVEALIDEGWRPQDVALLTTQSRHPEQLNRQVGGHEAYWDSFWDDEQVFYGTVLGFKGLERPAVVLAVNDKYDLDRAKERLYVGLSRARDLLVVVGDAAHIEAVGGPAVLRRITGG